MKSWDEQILLFAASHRSVVLDYFFRCATWLGSLYVLAPAAVLIAILLSKFHKRWEAALLLIGIGTSALSVHLAKALVGRSRPDLAEPVIALPSDASMPSAHTAQIVAFFLCVILIVRRILPEWHSHTIIIALVVSIIVAISRVYLQVHFPSDVLVGAVFGIVWIALIHRLL